MQVGRGREGWYIGVAVGVFVPALIIILGREVWGNNQDNLSTTIVNIGKALAPWMILAFGTSLLTVEGVTMVAEQYLRRRYRKGREDGRQEANREWQNWNERRMQAERENRPFDEPPPSSPSNQNGANA